MIKVLKANKKLIAISMLLIIANFLVEFLKISSTAKIKIEKIITSVLILSLTMLFESILTTFAKDFLRKKEIELTSLFDHIMKGVFFTIAILLVLENLGISIVPMVATLGLGSLAIALALQDPLKNLFSGIHLALTRKIKPGDYIKIEEGLEGYVEDITWSNTMIRTLSNNLIIVPNFLIISRIVTNYHLPDPYLAVTLDVGIGYNNDLEKVERITVETAKEVMRKIIGEIDFEPFIRYNKLSESHISFSVILRVREFSEQYLLKHELIKALHRRYKEERIELFYPVRMVFLKKHRKEGGLYGPKNP
ncbi:MAG: mechanosensitive ion channel family protein [Thermosulfidibacteraceae bacterium]|jgi:small-conductance mechanosensitive channel